MSGGFDLPDVSHDVSVALAEDLGVEEGRLRPGPDPHLLDRDVTGSLLPADVVFAGVIVAREPGVICGLPVVAATYDLLAKASGSPRIETYPLVAEGAVVEAGTEVAEIEGPVRVVVAGERTALDFLMVLSGIATETERWVSAADGVAVCDTRKTLPGMRALSKYAVRVGGGVNHRSGLSDMYLVKDNHIQAAGGIAAAVARARKAHPELAVEVEAEDIEQAAEAARCGADMVLLDNMDDVTLARAVAAVADATPKGRRCLTEASGGMSRDRLPALSAAGVDRVSASALTFARPLDFGLDER